MRAAKPLLFASILLLAPLSSLAAQAEEDEPEASARQQLEIYGFAMSDTGYNFGRSDPDWFDVVRPTKLPSFAGEFGKDGNWFAGVRQSKFGVKGTMWTPMGELKTQFEFDMFGVGDDAGLTTIRLRHAWGAIGQIGAGQSHSPFMDIDVFPNSLDYWGPNGMVFFRNAQVRWMPIQGPTSVHVAIEKPGASADLGRDEDRFDFDGITARFPLPDLSAHVRHQGEWGHVQLAGIVRYMSWDDVALDDGNDLSGHAWGWGVNLSGNVKLAQIAVVKLQAVYGEGIQNYMNDAGADVGTEDNPGDPLAPIRGTAVPMFGGLAFVDLNWNKYFTSSLGYSIVLTDNTEGQAPSAFRRGQYALANILFHPVEAVMLGPELQWAERANNSDDWTYDDFRLQFSLKYNFSKFFGATKKENGATTQEP